MGPDIMTDHAEPIPVKAQPLRVLEVGADEFFVLAVPEQTDFLWTGIKPRKRASFVLGPLKLIRAFVKLRRGEYDLLVIHAPQFAPWHPRSFLTALRDWHIRSPVGLFATFAWRIIHLFHRVPTVAIDFGDSCLIGRHNFFLLKHAQAFFKRELPSDHWLVFCKSGYPNFPGRRWRSKQRYIRMVERLRPISYGAPSNNFGKLSAMNVAADPEKATDVFFVGAVAGNSTVRESGLAELQALKREGFVIDIPSERLPAPEFFKRMSAAWLAWSPAGLGWDCGRHYEAPFVGTVPLMNSPNILRDAPLIDGKHCILYAPEPGGLVQAARIALADKPRLREMARAAAAHVAQHHTVLARAERVTVAILGRRLDGTRVEPK